MMQRIAIDMDEVLADYESKAIATYQQEYGEYLVRSELEGYHIEDYVPPAHRQAVLGFPHRKGFFRDLPVMPDSQEVMKELNEKYELFVVSAAMEFPNCLEDKYYWMQEHFNFIPWTHIVLCGYKSIIQADYLVDDHARHLESFIGTPILFHANHNIDEDRFQRVASWSEMAKLFL